MEISNDEGLMLSTLESNSVDLVLTDPPYIISKESGMNTLFEQIQLSDGENVKTEADWEEYKKTLKKPKGN